MQEGRLDFSGAVRYRVYWWQTETDFFLKKKNSLERKCGCTVSREGIIGMREPRPSFLLVSDVDPEEGDSECRWG